MTPATDAPTRPALRYHGAKWVLSSWIVSCLPADHDSYIEPFGGSAARTWAAKTSVAGLQPGCCCR